MDEFPFLFFKLLNESLLFWRLLAGFAPFSHFSYFVEQLLQRTDHKNNYNYNTIQDINIIELKTFQVCTVMMIK